LKTLSQLDLNTVEEGEIKKRYSIEMFEELIQRVLILTQEVKHLKTEDRHYS
jgi:hypothetical protein